MGYVRIDQGKLRAVMGPMVDAAARRAAMVTSARAKDNVTRSGRVRTGAMRARITSRRSGRASALYGCWQVISPAPYSAFQEFGTAPHVIRPKRSGGVLVFDVGGTTVFTRHVRHPGISPAHFLTDAVSALRPSDYAL